MLASKLLTRSMLSVAVVAALAGPAAGQFGYVYPVPGPQLWPPSSPGFPLAPLPPVFQPYQFPSFPPNSGIFFFPGFLFPPYGSVVVQPGYPGLYPFGYPSYWPYPYQYGYYNGYYGRPGPYAYHWRHDDRRRPEERSAPGSMNRPGTRNRPPRQGMPAPNLEEPTLGRPAPNLDLLPSSSANS